MPFDAELFIYETRQAIAERRRQARWSKVYSFTVFAVGLTLFACAGIQAMLLDLWTHRFENPFLGSHAGSIWLWFDNNATMIWHFVAALPFPKALPQENYYLPWVLFAAFYVLILVSSTQLKARAIRLKSAADEAERGLNAQEFLLRHMNSFSAAAGDNQNVNVGVAGSGNVVTATASITNILHGAESRWWQEPLGLIGLAVFTAALNKLLHLT